MLDTDGPALMIKHHGESSPVLAIEDMPKENEKSRIAWDAVMANPFVSKIGTLSA